MSRLGLMFVSLAVCSAPPGITEIRLERTPCYGTCPVDEVVLRPDGTAEYIGKRFVERTGRYEGTFDGADFARIARLMEAKGFFDLMDRYTKPITDNPSLITSATRGDRTKRVENYARAG